jgi:tetratricopeptide (TPR) repeat protein
MATDPTTSEINELKKKLDENPDSLVFAALADAYRKKGRLDEALNVCKKGLEKNPSYTSARVVLGRIYREQGKVEEGASEFKKVLELDQDNLMAHSMLGSILMEKNDYQTAIEEYQKILSLNPDDEETQSHLKQAIEKAAGETKPSKLFKKDLPPAEKKDPRKESTATLTLAELYFKQGHYDRAIEVYQELLANDPQNLMLRQKMSEVITRQQKESAVDAASSKLKRNEFTQPPDQKEDVIVDEGKSEKHPAKEKKGDDFKFTNEDILLVMRRGGKDDVVVEEKTPPPPVKKSEPPAAVRPTPEVKAALPPSPINPEQVNALKEMLGELISVNGMIGCFFINTDGNVLVSLGEADKSPDLVKQAQAIFQSTDRSAAQMNQGKLQQVLVTAQTGHILLVSFAKLSLIALASERVNLGLLRLALDSGLKKLDKFPSF